MVAGVVAVGCWGPMVCRLPSAPSRLSAAITYRPQNSAGHGPDAARSAAVATGQSLARHPVAAKNKKPKSLNDVIDNIRNLLVGLLVSLAALFVVIAGLLYLVAGGDMRATETAKGAVKCAVIGFVLAGAATLIVAALKRVVNVE